MKQPFRYFREEFARGVYLYALVICPNLAVQDVIDELVYQTCFQWKLEDEVAANEMPIRDEDIINIAKIAGVFQSLGQFMSNTGSLYFSRSFLAQGIERSERGLFDIDREVFEYIRLETDNYPDDIAVEASLAKRISVVPKDTEPVGYVPAGVPLFDINGNILWENILPEPPDTGAYAPFFGEKYLVFEEEFIKETTLSVPVLKLLFECLQRIRYGGPTISSFLEVTKVLGEGYIYDIEIIPQYVSVPPRPVLFGDDVKIGGFKIGYTYPAINTSYYEVQYKLSRYVIIDNHLRRYAAWQIVCSQKFKQFKLVDVTPV